MATSSRSTVNRTTMCANVRYRPERTQATSMERQWIVASNTRVALVLCVLIVGACEWPWSIDGSHDPSRCEPRCSAGVACIEGMCVQRDAGAKPDVSMDVEQSRCGDGIKDKTESCDGAQLDGKTCLLMGFSGGTLRCKSDCTFDSSGCHKCGDWKVSGPEQCDGGNLDGKSCTTMGFWGGEPDLQAELHV